jgi:hypothetical protein
MKSDLPRGGAFMQQRRGRELPNQWDQPVADVGRIVSIALELGLEGLFLEHRPHGVRQIAETTQPIRYDFLFGSCIGSTADIAIMFRSNLAGRPRICRA